MNKNLTMHAQERALERYGFVPSRAEVAEIMVRASSGNLPVRRSTPEPMTYVITLRGVTCLPVIVDGKIVTFAPSDYGTANGRKRYLHKRNGAQRPKNAKDKWGFDEYRRPHASEITAMADEGEI